MASNFGMTPLEIDEVHFINPETAAHNIALAYVNLSVKSDKLSQGDDALTYDVLSISNQYVDAYNYAYNFVSKQNKFIDDTE